MENQFCGGVSALVAGHHGSPNRNLAAMDSHGIPRFAKDHCNASVAATSTACLAGAIFGQLTFGHLADVFGVVGPRRPGRASGEVLSMVPALTPTWDA